MFKLTQLMGTLLGSAAASSLSSSMFSIKPQPTVTEIRGMRRQRKRKGQGKKGRYVFRSMRNKYTPVHSRPLTRQMLEECAKQEVKHQITRAVRYLNRCERLDLDPKDAPTHIKSKLRTAHRLDALTRGAEKATQTQTQEA